jgi:hypothetical protein
MRHAVVAAALARHTKLLSAAARRSSISLALADDEGIKRDMGVHDAL